MMIDGIEVTVAFNGPDEYQAYNDAPACLRELIYRQARDLAVARVASALRSSGEAVADVATRQEWYEREIAKAERQWIDGFSRRYEEGDDVPSMGHFVALWLAERTPPTSTKARRVCNRNCDCVGPCKAGLED